MWKCHKCGKPVYFAERKQSLGYDWHPECLRCEECGRRLNPGQHAEHKGVPYCHIPCYGVLFGPQLFGHGTTVESHKCFGQPREEKNHEHQCFSELEIKLKTYNQHYEGKSAEIRSRKVNGRLILEGSLRIYWGVSGMIHLKENDDQRTLVTVRKRNSARIVSNSDDDSDDSINWNDDPLDDLALDINKTTNTPNESDCDNINTNNYTHYQTLPSKLTEKADWDVLDELLVVERQDNEGISLYHTMPVSVTSQNSLTNMGSSTETVLSSSDSEQSIKKSENSVKTNGNSPGEESSENSALNDDEKSLTENNDEHIVKKPSKTGPSAIKRRPGRKLSRSKIKRRCSINGHFYDRDTSFFTPPHGSQMSVWVTSLVNTQEIINLMLEKYKVDSDGSNFALFVVRDNGEQKRLKEDEYPLISRVMLGPHEDIVQLYLMDKQNTQEVSNDVAQFLNLSLAECRAILNQYYAQEEREVTKIKEKYVMLKSRIKQRMEDLKVRL